MRAAIASGHMQIETQRERVDKTLGEADGLKSGD